MQKGQKMRGNGGDLEGQRTGGGGGQGIGEMEEGIGKEADRGTSCGKPD